MASGTIIEWRDTDGVGRIRHDDGEVVRFGKTAIPNDRPELGRRCETSDLQPHPLGGHRATKVILLPGRGQVEPAAQTAAPDRSAWLAERLKSSITQPVANVEIQGLLDALMAFKGKVEGRQIFGVDATTIAPARFEELSAIATDALRQWAGTLKSASDRYQLQKAGRAAGLSLYRADELPALRCEPLGTLEGLDRPWLARMARLKEVLQGKRSLALESIGLSGVPSWGRPDRDGLYELALRFEADSERTFPRAYAAVLSLADGFSIADCAVVAHARDWEWLDDGLSIGSGTTMQGSLTLIETDGDVSGWALLDRDDDGVELHRFASFAAFWDTLLGT